MQSLSELNNVSGTSVTYTDERPSGVTLNHDVIFYYNQIDIVSQTVTVDPVVDIEEIIQSGTANVRYQITIKTEKSPQLTGSTITLPSLPSGTTSSVVGNVYTISNITTVEQWNQIKTIVWNLPANYSLCPVWYLETKIIYFDSSTSLDKSYDWLTFDTRFYYTSLMQSSFEVICNPTELVGSTKELTAALESTFDLVSMVSKTSSIDLYSKFTLVAELGLARAFVEMNTEFNMICSIGYASVFKPHLLPITGVPVNPFQPIEPNVQSRPLVIVMIPTITVTINASYKVDLFQRNYDGEHLTYGQFLESKVDPVIVIQHRTRDPNPTTLTAFAFEVVAILSSGSGDIIHRDYDYRCISYLDLPMVNRERRLNAPLLSTSSISTIITIDKTINITNIRYYDKNIGTSIFASNTPYNESEFPSSTYTIELSCTAGFLTKNESPKDNVQTISYTGNYQYINSKFNEIKYYPIRNSVASTTLSFKKYRDTNLIEIKTINLSYSGVIGTIVPVITSYSTAGSFSYKIPLDSYLYGTVSYAVIGGGGGGSGSMGIQDQYGLSAYTWVGNGGWSGSEFQSQTSTVYSGGNLVPELSQTVTGTVGAGGNGSAYKQVIRNSSSVTMENSFIAKSTCCNTTTGKFVSVGSVINADGNREIGFAVSDNGYDWWPAQVMQVSGIPPILGELTGVSVNPTTGVFVAVGYSTETNKPITLTSTDGHTWPELVTINVTGRLTAIAVSPSGVFLAVGNKSTGEAFFIKSQITTYNNIMNWTTSAPIGSEGDLYHTYKVTSIACNSSGRFVVIGHYVYGWPMANWPEETYPPLYDFELYSYFDYPSQEIKDADPLVGVSGISNGNYESYVVTNYINSPYTSWVHPMLVLTNGVGKATSIVCSPTTNKFLIVGQNRYQNQWDDPNYYPPGSQVCTSPDDIGDPVFQTSNDGINWSPSTTSSSILSQSGGFINFMKVNTVTVDNTGRFIVTMYEIDQSYRVNVAGFLHQRKTTTSKVYVSFSENGTTWSVPTQLKNENNLSNQHIYSSACNSSGRFWLVGNVRSVIQFDDNVNFTRNPGSDGQDSSVTFHNQVTNTDFTFTAVGGRGACKSTPNISRLKLINGTMVEQISQSTGQGSDLELVQNGRGLDTQNDVEGITTQYSLLETDNTNGTIGEIGHGGDKGTSHQQIITTQPVFNITHATTDLRNGTPLDHTQSIIYDIPGSGGYGGSLYQDTVDTALFYLQNGGKGTDGAVIFRAH